MKLPIHTIAAAALLATVSMPVYAIEANVGVGADVNARPAASASDMSIRTGTDTVAPAKSNAAKSTFGVKTSSTLKARAERNELTEAEREDLARSREADKRRSGTYVNTQPSAGAQVDMSGKGVNTSTIGNAEVGIGTNVGTRTGGGTRR